MSSTPAMISSEASRLTLAISWHLQDGIHTHLYRDEPICMYVYMYIICIYIYIYMYIVVLDKWFPLGRLGDLVGDELPRVADVLPRPVDFHLG